jgi:pterin-4a-carbinolamine dehydratase
MSEGEPSDYRIGNLIFLSYRRADTTAQTLALKLELEKSFSAAQVFMDNSAIDGGEQFPDELDHALRAAKVIIAVIGKNWQGDLENGNRRIDNENDWVRKEIEYALSDNRDSFIPLFLDNAAAMTTAELPEKLKRLASTQFIKIDSSNWENSIKALLELLDKKFNFKLKENRFKLPDPGEGHKRYAPAYPWEILQKHIMKHLPSWSIEFSDDPDKYRHKWVDLRRDFEFGSYDAAVKFVKTITDHSIAVNHHPRTLLTWCTVTVWTSTWVAGHIITTYDVEFANFLEAEFRKLIQ